MDVSSLLILFMKNYCNRQITVGPVNNNNRNDSNNKNV